ncbi:hypothetical protein AVEN_261195-1, partial [Araneus ventricosus]
VVGIPECQFGPIPVPVHRGLLSQKKHAIDRCLRWINSCSGLSLHLFRLADAPGVPKLRFRHGTRSEPRSSHVIPHDWSIFQEEAGKSGSHRHIGYRGRSHHLLLQFCKDHQNLGMETGSSRHLRPGCDSFLRLHLHPSTIPIDLITFLKNDCSENILQLRASATEDSLE